MYICKETLDIYIWKETYIKYLHKRKDAVPA